MVKPVDTAAVVLGVLLAFGLFVWARVDPPAASGPAPAVQAGRPVADIPLIDLARLDTARGSPEASGRDVFGFGASSALPAGETGPPVSLAPEPPITAAASPAAPVVPTFNVKFVGSVERRGAKVAVLMTDKKELLTGQAGEVVANRLRIVRIGLESIDVQDVGGGAQRRLPLRAN